MEHTTAYVVGFILAWALSVFAKACYQCLPENKSPLTYAGWTEIPFVKSLPSLFSGAPHLAIIDVLVFGLTMFLWATQPASTAIPATALMFFCAVCSVVDLKHRIIPYQMTLPFVVLGLLLAAAFPGFIGQKTWQSGVVASFAGLLAGGLGIAAIVEFGKIAFGRLVRKLDPPEKFRFRYDASGNNAIIADEEELSWQELFNRKKDKLILFCPESEVDGEKYTNNQLTISWDTVQRDSEPPIALTEATSFSGIANKIVIPREAMGYGDAQFLIVVGAFLGWQAAVSVIFAGAVIGAVIGIALKMTGRGNVMPFIPALALGVATWGLFGSYLKAFYF